MILKKIRPTRLGLYLLGLNFILFLLATGYSNNLLFLFTLILIGQSFYWYVETLKYDHPGIGDLKISNSFAGSPSIISFSTPETRFKKLYIQINGKKFNVTDFVRNDERVIVSIQLPKRGKYFLESLSFYDSRPFGLFAKKITLVDSRRFYVYPQILKSVSLTTSMNEEAESGTLDSHQKGEESFLGLDPYQGEDFKKISWKHFARTDDVYVKQGLAPLLSHYQFKLSETPSEEEISRVASMMMLAHLNQSVFSLKIKDMFIHPESSQSHLHHCLERLAEC